MSTPPPLRPRADPGALAGIGPLDRVARALSTERRLIGAACLRIGVAAVLLAYLVGQWPRRHLLWGPDAIYPLWLVARDRPGGSLPSPFAVGDPWLFDLLYHAAILAVVAYLVGWRTRWTGPLVYVVAWSLFRRNPFIMTGGDNLLLVCLPWLLLMNTGAYLSFDSRWRRPWDAWRPAPRPYAALVHNLALGGLLGQLAIMYLFAGLHKLGGAPWLDGSATAYILRVDRFSLPWLGPLLVEGDIVGRAITYWTLVFELSVPLLIWWRATRWLVAVQALLFHGGIAVLMGLVIFAAEATLFQAVVFGDDAYRGAFERLHRLRSPVATARSQTGRGWPGRGSGRGKSADRGEPRGRAAPPAV